MKESTLNGIREDSGKRSLRIGPDSAIRPMPVIAVTALAMEGDQERILAGGGDGCLPKPVRIQLLRPRVGGFLNGSGSSTASLTPAP
ncbi:MAG: hypothetical protein O3B24_02325 [Verrucomicrobia bacterium]|nr:hypothetical protein [Verrucomicrobiota bacterium]